MPEDTKEPAGIAAGPFGELLGQAPYGSSLVFHNEPGIEAEPFLYEVAHHHLDQGRDVVMVLLNRSPSTVTSEMAGLGYPPSDCNGQLVFVDAFSKMLGVSEDTAYRIEDTEGSDALVEVLEEAARDHPGGVLLVDSLSTWIDRLGAEEVRKAWPRLEEVFEAFQLTSVLHTEWPYENDIQDLLERFDAEVWVEYRFDDETFELVGTFAEGRIH